MDFTLTKQQKLVQKTMREFAEKELKPLAGAVDRYEASTAENLKKLAKLNLFGLPLPKEEGGAGGDYISYVIALEEASKVCASTGNSLSGRMSGLLIEMLYTVGTPEQKQKYLRPLLRGEITGCFALTEPNAGSDSNALTTRAQRDGSDFIINGAKCFITNGGRADFAIIMARTDPEKGAHGVTAFVVPTSTPGFAVGKEEKKMGMRGLCVNELIFTNMRVSEKDILGKEGNGFVQAMVSLDSGRLGIAAQAVGIAQGALCQRNGKRRQQVAQNEIRRRQRRGIEAGKEGALPILCHQGRRKQGEERQPEHRNAGRKSLNLKKLHRDIGLNGRQKQQEHHREADAEAHIQRVAQDLLCRPAGKCAQLHFASPFTMAMNASSNFSLPVWCFSSSAVPTVRSLPSFMMPMRSDSASASSI